MTQEDHILLGHLTAVELTLRMLISALLAAAALRDEIAQELQRARDHAVFQTTSEQQLAGFDRAVKAMDLAP